MFRRRDRAPLLERARQFVYPRTGWRRSLEYVALRIRRIPDTPHRIALGFSCGVFLSFTPFFGAHLLGSMALAWLIRGNILAAAIGQFVGNPLTLPLIAASSMALGRRILGEGGPAGRSFERIDQAIAIGIDGLRETMLSWIGMGESQWHKVALVYSDVILPYFVGGLGPGIAASVVSYWIVRTIVGAYQSAVRARRAERARLRADDGAAAGGAADRGPSEAG